MEFDILRIDGVFNNWEITLLSGRLKEIKRVVWEPPSEAALKFNVDGAARAKSRPLGG